ncbi:MAG: Wzz/FepE/Etk N-terminal domain-containing protein [Desulfonauticus sp.]|nr:Wzz/FepE/Etk N-terminal domain-containing protein [Desulfonauticus sp.]
MEKEQKIPYPYLPPYYEEDEIDLYELWLTLKKRKWVISITTIIFLLIAFSYLLLAKDIYKIKFAFEIPKIEKDGTVICLGASTYEIKQGIETISSLLKEGRYDELKKILSIEDPKNIVSISSDIPRGNKDIIEITVESINNQDLLPLQRKIANYLKGIPNIKKKVELKKEILTKEIESIKKQVNDIENLKKKLLAKKTLDKNEIEGITTLELLIKDLKTAYFTKYNELKNLKPFILIETNVTPKKPYKPKKKLILAVALVTGLFLGIFLAFFLEWLENAKKREKERS